MKFAVFTASTPEWTPQEAVETLSAQGWDGIEWRITDQKSAETPGFWAGNRSTWPFTGLEDRLDEISALTSGAGLALSAIGGYERCDDHDGVERMLAATARLGADKVRVTTLALGNSSVGGGAPSGRPYPELFDETREHFHWVAERAAHHGVTALVELHRGTVVASASSALRLLDGIDPRQVAVIHDVGNLISEGQEDTLSGFQMLGERLAHVHVKNTRWVGTPSEETGEFAGTVDWAPQPAPLRAGQADLVAYFRALRAVGYDGWITVEDFSTALPLAERTADNLRYLHAVAARVAGE
ncbi:sugar phosphate isomerase/epimerase family protein [Gryllotalpicola reticulitermitis]|uniref:Sugar phosphate isomerase/epimerase family protein n=1 Tax=Gryllotalpicola reticulitermitis TaxID=1184153 RepID=A0ABV8QE73_9MICO